jgi:signal transduction histidine kinase
MKEKFDLEELVADIVNEHSRILKKSNKNINLTYIFRDDISGKAIVEADRSRVSQVVTNLISNATKFTQEGNVIVTMEIRDDENAIVVRVKDTGEGINSEILPRLFTKFASSSFTGTGLGLYISKSILGEHGGRMWADNNVDGKGASFYFTLPLKKITVTQ